LAQLEFAKATRLKKKELARWQRNVVDMAIHGSYQIFHESMEKSKYNQTNPPTPEVVTILGEHEVDLTPDADEDRIPMARNQIWRKSHPSKLIRPQLSLDIWQ
jgi:hypothetical protein